MRGGEVVPTGDAASAAMFSTKQRGVLLRLVEACFLAAALLAGRLATGMY